MFYGWLCTGRTGRQQAENALSTAILSSFYLAQHEEISKYLTCSLRVLPLVFRISFTSLGIYYAPLAQTITGSITIAFPGKKSSKQAGNNYDGIHSSPRVDLHSVAGQHRNKRLHNTVFFCANLGRTRYYEQCIQLMEFP